MGTCDISIIVPVYNAQCYLEVCVNSILNQTYKNFELILVNDGSTDNSFNICNKFEAQDSRIIVVNKENGGVSTARNEGIKVAKGDYITFIDADDWVEQDYIEKLRSAITADEDLIQSGILFFDNNTGAEIGRETLPLIKSMSIYAAEENCFLVATMPLITSPVSKLYKRELILKHNIRFEEGLAYGEDRDFNLKYLDVAECVSAVDYVGYHYRKEVEGSLSKDRDYLKLLQLDVEYWSRLQNYFARHNYQSERVNHYLANRLYNFYNDRIIQYFAWNKPSQPDAMKVINELKSEKEFAWLKENINFVEANKVAKLIYKSGISYLLYHYFRRISANG